MIIRSLLRRPTAAQALVTAPAKCFSPPLVRWIHNVPSLDNHEEIKANGIKGLFSRRQFEIAYTEYQQHILDDVNTVTAGTQLENQDVKSLVVEFARQPTTAYAFNVASMAYNNHFFFSGISTNPDVHSAPSSNLTDAIKKDFSSLDSLREEFLATAEAMFGPGFVWLVQQDDIGRRPLRILPTYLAGTPISGAHYRRQSQDLNTHNPDSYQNLNNVGTFGAAAGRKQGPKKPLGGVDILPLLCVNTWEHVWLHDYGVKGKREYLERWWDKINWNSVESHGKIEARKPSYSSDFR